MAGKSGDFSPNAELSRNLKILVSAIDDLVEFVRRHTARYNESRRSWSCQILTLDEKEQLIRLDAAVYGLSERCGLMIPEPKFQGDRFARRLFGFTKISHSEPGKNNHYEPKKLSRIAIRCYTEWFDRMASLRAAAEALIDATKSVVANANPKADSDTLAPAKMPKRSTERGEGRAKLIAALTNHHKYADGGCLNLEPVVSNELARQAEVSTSTASEFFNNEFNAGQKKGYAKYRVTCRDAGRLVDSLKALNGEFSPHDLYGRRPAGEDNRDDEE